MQPEPGVVTGAATQLSFLGIRLEGWLTITAIVLGPIIALALQRWSERRRELRWRKLFVFKELMATRASSSRVSSRHVDALNAIEIEFSGRGDKPVLDAWQNYLDQLNTPFDAESKDASARWNDKVDDMLVDLLYEMSKGLGYDFSKVSLRKGIYYPKAHGDLETDQWMLRKYFLEVMAGTRMMGSKIVTGDQPLKMEIVNLPVRPPTAEPEEGEG
jgi:Family of unknown function (DUF6680)